MTTHDIAERLVALNRTADYKTAYAELFSSDIVSTEHGMGPVQAYQGMEGVQEKAKKWEENLVEVHSMKVSEPVVADKSFAVTFSLDATFKDMGHQSVTELAVYQVDDGKIVREDFYA